MPNRSGPKTAPLGCCFFWQIQWAQKELQKQFVLQPKSLSVVETTGRLIFIHLTCWEVLPFLTIQRQRCIKFRVLRTQDFYTPLPLNCQKGQHPPALVVYQNQSPNYVNVSEKSVSVTRDFLPKIPRACLWKIREIKSNFRRNLYLLYIRQYHWQLMFSVSFSLYTTIVSWNTVPRHLASVPKNIIKFMCLFIA